MATYKHIRSSTAHKRPTTAIADGQIAINTNTASPGLFFKDSAGTGIVKVGPVHVGTSAPNASPAAGGSSGNYLGEQWLDTSLTPAQLKVWNGSAWVGVVADELPVSKLQDGAARQLLQTDAAGTGVEWTSNVYVPGTLDVTGATTLDSTLTVPLGSAAAPTVRFTGDTDTGIYSPGADQVAISTNGTGQVFITSNGNAGIGTLNASNVAGKLHLRADGDEYKSLLVLQNRDAGSSAGGAINFVNGAVNLSDNRYSYIRGITTGAGQNGNHLAFGTNQNGLAPSERLRITSAGLVGIGTSSPGSPLHIVNSSAGTANGIELTNFTGNSSYVKSGRSLTLSADFDANSGATESYISFETDAVEKVRIDDQGRVGIGTTSPAYTLDVAGQARIGAPTGVVQLELGAGATENRDAYIDFVTDTTYTDYSFRIRRAGGGPNSNTTLEHRGTGDLRFINQEAAPYTWYISGTERARIDSSGRLLVGTSSWTTGATAAFVGNSSVSTGNGVVNIARGKSAVSLSDDEQIGGLYFSDNAGSTFAEIISFVDATPGSGDYPGRLVFSTTADGNSSPTERMTIDNGGRILIGTTTDGGAGGVTIRPDSSNGAAAIIFDRADTAATSTVFAFENNDGTVGSITYTNTATAFNTSSDYRLKENVVDLDGAIDRVKQLAPKRFNFIADADTTVDGFLAHEAQTVVPEAITGEKDAVDDEGNPVYQGIDQSKLVPLLTAALQEAIGRIETLEAEVAALKG